MFESLLAEEPANLDSQRNVALVEKYLGGHYQGNGDLANALRHHGRALELDRRRAEAEPQNRQAQLDLAIDLGNVAWIHKAADRFAEAVAAYEQSLDIRRRLSESDPKDDYARGRLAFVLNNLANWYSTLGRHAEALAHAREAVAIADARRSVDSQNRTELVDYLSNLARIERAASRLDASCATARRAARSRRRRPRSPRRRTGFSRGLPKVSRPAEAAYLAAESPTASVQRRQQANSKPMRFEGHFRALNWLVR